MAASATWRWSASAPAASPATGRSAEHWTFYEIDPTVVRIARDPRMFRFLSECAPSVPVVLGDARLTLAAAEARYDLIVLDAFSSDTIPVHLLTAEAFAIYLAHLSPHGVLVIHGSNRHLDLVPVIAAAAKAAGLVALHKDDADRRPGGRQVQGELVRHGARARSGRPARSRGPRRLAAARALRRGGALDRRLLERARRHDPSKTRIPARRAVAPCAARWVTLVPHGAMHEQRSDPRRLRSAGLARGRARGAVAFARRKDRLSGRHHRPALSRRDPVRRRPRRLCVRHRQSVALRHAGHRALDRRRGGGRHRRGRALQARAPASARAPARASRCRSASASRSAASAATSPASTTSPTARRPRCRGATISATACRAIRCSSTRAPPWRRSRLFYVAAVLAARPLRRSPTASISRSASTALQRFAWEFLKPYGARARAVHAVSPAVARACSPTPSP